MTKISVIVPVYNIEKEISKCLNSLVNQKFDDYEVIVVNDGSTDDSQIVIDKYVKTYPDIIKAFKKKNGGLSDARNYGIKKARGNYISFVDGDDFVSNNMLQVLYKKAQEGYDIVSFNYSKIWDDGKKLNFYNSFTSNYRGFIVNFPMAWNKLYKKSLFDDEFKFKKGVYYEDLELIPSLVLKTDKIAFIEDCLYFYYQRSSSIMNQNVFNEKLLDIFVVLNSLEERFKTHEKYQFYEGELEYLNVEHLLYSAGLRFSLFPNDGKKYIEKVSSIIKNKYPNFKRNRYYKMKSIKFKVICWLTYHRFTKTLKLLNSLKK